MGPAVVSRRFFRFSFLFFIFNLAIGKLEIDDTNVVWYDLIIIIPHGKK